MESAFPRRHSLSCFWSNLAPSSCSKRLKNAPLITQKHYLALASFWACFFAPPSFTLGANMASRAAQNWCQKRSRCNTKTKSALMLAKGAFGPPFSGGFLLFLSPFHQFGPHFEADLLDLVAFSSNVHLPMTCTCHRLDPMHPKCNNVSTDVIAYSG